MNWLSFIYGGAVATVGTLAVIFVTGFGRAAGADAWHLLKKKISPPPQEVRRDYRTDVDCSWVQETRTPEREDAGYQFYKEKRAKCYRRTAGGKEFLMKRPTN